MNSKTTTSSLKILKSTWGIYLAVTASSRLLNENETQNSKISGKIHFQNSLLTMKLADKVSTSRIPLRNSELGSRSL